MSKRLYVGNLPFSITEDELREIFEPHGPIESVSVITDRETGRPRGFAFVEVENGDQAIEAVNGTELGGRTLRVNEAHERGGGGGGGGGRGGGGRGRY